MSGVRYADLDGRVAVVTGAKGGIGRAIVAALRTQGCRVVAADLPVEGVEPGPDEVTLDVTDEHAALRVCSGIVDRHGRLDIWINNAGLLKRSPALELQRSDWDLSLAVNLTGSFFAAQAAAHHMAPNGGGTIVNLSSYAGQKARPNCADYASAKAGVAHLTACLALEWGKLGIRVNAIAPGYIDTPMSGWMHEDAALRRQYVDKTPVGRIGIPQDIAAAAMFLCSDQSSFVSGQVLTVDGGISLS